MSINDTNPIDSNDPEQIRAEIARTRASLSGDVDALTDTANPKNIARRQGDKVKNAATGVVDKVMGTASDTAHGAQDAISGAAHGVGDSVAGAPGAATSKTRGNPLAAGLIAFGAGLLIAGLIPSSQKEQRAASDLVDRAEPLKAKAQEAVQEMGGNLQQPAQEAAEAVKESATGAMQSIKDEGGSAVSDVRGQAQDSKQAVQESNRS